MNKEQKEVQQIFLKQEKQVINDLKRMYKESLDQVNEKIQNLLGRSDADELNVIYQIEYQKNLKTQIEGIMLQLQSNQFETISDYLKNSYNDGFIGTMYDMQNQGVPLIFPIDQKAVVNAIVNKSKLTDPLYERLGYDIKKLQKDIASEISRGLSTGLSYNDIARNIEYRANVTRNKAALIARTEAHRIQCQATSDAQFKAKEKGADVVKQWDAFLDGRTRKTHRELDGQIRELEEPFEYGRYEAMFPGEFGNPALDCNCRCALLQRARWALGNDFTKWDQENGIVEIKADGYDDFKNKYLKESERVRSGSQKIKSKVESLNEYTVDGVVYKVDGKHIILDNKLHEKEIANLMAEKLNKDVQIVPKIVYPQGISTPDYIIGGQKYDLKEPEGSGKNVLYNMINKKKRQAHNFIYDISKCPLDIDEINRQIEGIYSSTHTAFVEEIIVVKDREIIKIHRRDK